MPNIKRYRYLRSFQWPKIIKSTMFPEINGRLKGLHYRAVCPDQAQTILQHLFLITLVNLADEAHVDHHRFTGFEATVDEFAGLHPCLRYNGLTIIKLLGIFLQGRKILVWEAKAILRIWREICCNKNGYPFPRRARQVFHLQSEYLLFLLPRRDWLCGKMPSYKIQRELHQALHRTLAQFSIENGIEFRLGYCCADHLGGSPQYPLWHKHVIIGMHRLLRQDKERWLGMKNNPPNADALWPFFRSEPLILCPDRMRIIRSAWNFELENIFGQKVVFGRDLVLKRHRKLSAIQTRRKDTKRVANYNSGVTHDPYRFIFKISKGAGSILLMPREGIDWRNKPSGAWLENFNDFIQNRLLAPLAKCVRRTNAGYMHSNDSFAGLIAHAQQLNMLEDRPSAIAARGLSAAMEQGWI